jgi:urease accessory protein
VIRSLRPLLVIPAALVATPALAHPGHGIGGGFWDGVLHPLTGWDHLGAMLLIGAWAGSLSRRAPAVMLPRFLTAMFVGFASGALLHASAIEWMVTASVLMAGAAVFARWRAPLPVAASLAALFGFAHGQAHGVDVPDVAPITPFAIGFLIASAALLAIGAWVTRALARKRVRAA